MTLTLRPQIVSWFPILIGAAVVAASLVFVVAAKVETVQRTYALDRLHDEERKLAEVQRRLRNELAILRSPARLEELAPGLELGPPTVGQVIVVTHDALALGEALDAHGPGTAVVPVEAPSHD